MILSCDIHHQSLGTENQKYSDRSELECAYDFFKMCEERKIKSTFFFSGLAFKEDWNEKFEEICSSDLVEIGGHNWDCFSNTLIHRLFNKVIGSYNGTISMQKRDCERTKEMCLLRTGREIETWRNHMYMHGPNTNQALGESGIIVCSDGVDRHSQGFSYDGSIYSLPINTIPDHEHLYHAERTEEWVENWIKRYNWQDDFRSQSYYIKEWTEIYLKNLSRMQVDKRLPVSIIHPITMYLADKYKSIETILDVIQKSKTVSILEALYEAESSCVNQNI